jgi:hypothetical protein
VALVRTTACSAHQLLVTANVPRLPILVTLMIEVIVPPKRRFLQEPHGIASQKIAFFIVTAVKTSSLTSFKDICILLLEHKERTGSGSNFRDIVILKLP